MPQPRGILPRIPLLRNFVPRVSTLGRPLLPFTSLSSTTTPRPPTPTRLFSRFPARLTSQQSTNHHNSSSSSSNDGSGSGAGANPTLTQRLKHLIKSYGWYALGVYFILSTLDFSVAFLSINLLGASYVSQVTHSVKSYIHTILPSSPSSTPEPGREEMDPVPAHAEGGQESFYAMLVLAYMVHKTLFLPFRVGVTAAITPRLVGWLRARGWAGGEGAKRGAREMRERVRAGRDRD